MSKSSTSFNLNLNAPRNFRRFNPSNALRNVAGYGLSQQLSPAKPISLLWGVIPFFILTPSMLYTGMEIMDDKYKTKTNKAKLGIGVLIASFVISIMIHQLVFKINNPAISAASAGLNMLMPKF